MRNMIRIYSYIILLLLLSGGLSYAQEMMVDRIVAVVGDEIILLSDVQQKLRQEMMNRQYDTGTSPQVLQRLQNEIIRGMIDDNLLTEKAAKDSIIADPRDIDQFFNERMAELKQTLKTEENFQAALVENGMTEQQLRHMFRVMAEKNVIQRMLMDRIKRRISVTPQDLEVWYEAHKDSLPSIPEQFKLSHIMIVPKASEDQKLLVKNELERILERARSGEDFAALATQYSEDPGTKDDGGDIGYFPRGVLVKEFTDVAFSLKEGEISDIVETQYGYHIIKVEGIRTRTDENGNEVKEVRARHILRTLADQDATIKQLSALRDKILSGEVTFETMATEYSEDQDSRNLGGKLDWQTQETLLQVNIPSFYIQAKKLEKGQISEPFKSNFGYHILKLDDYRPEHVLNLKEDRNQIENVLYQEKTYRELERVLAELRADTYIDVRLE
ncbi:MAG: peptidylprolyl isomerase [Candidatus Latescibacteria bacterium]|nr:peptidylprolyl isomerase [Candidatus Latescibacterota bacterium]